MTLSGVTIPGLSGPGSDVNKGDSAITRASPSDCLVSYPGHTFGEYYPSAEIQSVLSTNPAE